MTDELCIFFFQHVSKNSVQQLSYGGLNQVHICNPIPLAHLEFLKVQYYKFLLLPFFSEKC